MTTNKLMLLGTITTIIVLLEGCGKPYVDPAFQSYVSQFQDDAKAHGVDASQLKSDVIFGSVSSIGEVMPSASASSNLAVEAECRESTFLGLFNSYSIIVDQGLWNAASEVERKVLIYHELGHCQLNEEHRNGVVNGVPVSIMSAVSISVISNYSAHENEYLDELFNNSK